MTKTLSELTGTVARLGGWLRDHGRPFFAQWDAERLQTLERMLEEANDVLKDERRELPVCFLGNAGVGKSTLINSLVDPVAQVVPQGGVGPLTAQATVVRYAERPYLRAKYFGPKKLNQLMFALDRLCERQLRRAAAEDSVGLDLATQNEVLFVLSTSADATDEERQVAESRARAYVSQARLLITGNQFGEDNEDETSYLADMLRIAVGGGPAWGHKMRPADKSHIENVRRTAAIGEDGKFIVADDDRSSFLGEIRQHATGSIAPLIKSLEVGWQSDVLRSGITLVDLPGVGVANDEYRSVTSEWIRKATAVVLVVDRAGVTEASADMLRVTGFMNSLLHRAPDSKQISPLLWVAAVKLDDVARDERTSFKQQNPGEKLPRWIEFFQQSCGKVNGLIRSQLHQELEKQAGEAPAEIRDGRIAAQTSVLEQLQVHAVSAIEYRKLMAADEDDRALIAAPEESNLPALAHSMSQLAGKHLDEIANHATEISGKLIGSIKRGLLTALEDLEGTVKNQRLEETRARFVKFVAPYEKQLHLRQGQLRERLRETIPATIEKEVRRGISVANRGVAEYVQTLQKTHWATLRATVRRGGVRVGRRTVDLPNELALKFEEPLAVIWNRSVVDMMKAALESFATDVQRILGEVIKWAVSTDGRLDGGRVERYREDVTEQLGRLLDVGRANAKLLREEVKKHLHETMEATIRTECQTFVQSGRDRGTGAGQRVINFLKDAIATATVEAANKASALLVETYQNGIGVVSQEFSRVAEALNHAQTMLIGEPQKNDASRAQQVGRVRELLATLPALPAAS